MERVTGIEPAFRAWEARVLPLNYTRVEPTLCPIPKRFSRPARYFLAGTGGGPVVDFRGALRPRLSPGILRFEEGTPTTKECQLFDVGTGSDTIEEIVLAQSSANSR